MSMIRKKYIDEITESLAVLQAKVGLSNANNFTDINIHSENFYRDFLNLLYGYQLENLNAEQQNTAGYDLGDESKRVAFQVTSTSGLKKTRDTVTAFVKRGLDKKYDRLIILNISKKSKHREKKVGEKGGFSIDTQKDIWDSSDILRDINNLGIEKLEKIHAFLKRQLSTQADNQNTQNTPLGSNAAPSEDRLHIENQENTKLLKQIAGKLGINTSDSIELIDATQDSSGFTTQLDSEIDGYRDLLRSNQPQTALKLLEALEKRLPKNTDPRIIYRVKANISACHLSLDEYEIAGQGYLDAYKACPEAPKADAHKVLGLVLLGKSEEALKFGISAQETTKDLETLVSNTIVALKTLPKEKQSLDFIPNEVAENEHVLISKIDFLRSLEKREEWRAEAKRVYKLYPDTPILKRFYAESILDRIFEEWDGTEGSLNIKDFIGEINTAIQILETCWKDAETWENKSDGLYLSLASNLASAYRLIDKNSEATAIIDDALQKAPDDETLLEQRLAAALEINDKKKVEELLPRVPVTRNTALGHLQILFNEGDWDTIGELPAYEQFPDFTEGDKAFYEAVQFVAKYKAGNVVNPKEEGINLINRHENKIAVPILLFIIASEIGDREWAQNLYQKAKDLQYGASINRKLMLADIANELGDYQNIIELFEDKVLTDRDNPPLKYLAAAYVNSPITQNAANFAESLGDELLQNPYYARIKASIQFNYGALEEAEKSFLNALRLSKNDVSLHIGYINTLIRRDKQKQAKHHLEQIKIKALVGPAALKLGIAQMLMHFGDEQKGLDYGYEVALINQGDERVVLYYMGLILPNSPKLNIPVHVENIDEDCWVTLKSQDGKETNFILSDKINRPDLNHYTMSHELSKALLGKKVGEKIEYSPSMGTKNIYEIKEIKHRYIGLLHTLMSEFSKRFPNSTKLYSYTTEEGDVQPILDDIKKMSEAEEKVYKLYIDQKLPLAFLCGFSRFNVIEFANRLVSQGHFISSNVGTHEERAIGIKLCDDAIGKGIVIDTYTAWLCYTHDLIPFLKNLFGRIVIAQSTIDELQEWRHKFESLNGEPLMTIGYANGKHFREEVSVKQLKQSQSYLDKAIKYFKENFDVLPSAPPRKAGKLEQELLNSRVSSSMLDVGYIAQKEGLLLLSEDMSLRTVIKHELNVNGIWLQAALMVGEREELINLEEYSEAVYGLAENKHGHLSLSAAVLLSLCQIDESLQKYRRALDFIGNPTADVKSHFSVSRDFIIILWGSSLPDLTKCQATNLILEKLAIMAARHEYEFDFFKKLSGETTSLARRYIQDWFYGHYFKNL